MESVYLLLLIAIDMCFVLLMFHFFGKKGLITMYVLHIFLSQITINIPYRFLGLNSIIGSCFYGVLFLTMDMVSEHYGKEEANLTINSGICSLTILLVLIIVISNLIKLNVDNYSVEFLDLFNNQWRIIITDIFISYFLFQKINVLIFCKIKKLTNEKYLWLRNNVSTIISQIFTAILFYEFAFFGVMDQYKIWQIILSGLLIKIIISILETPFLYISKKVGVKVKYNEKC